MDYFSTNSFADSHTSVKDVPAGQLSPHYKRESVTSDTFLESLLSTAANTKVPIVVNDKQGKVQGIISRETILNSLQSA